MAERRSASVALALGVCLASCSGLFQRALPERAETFAAAAPGELWVGAAEADVTPHEPQYLAGYGVDRISQDVHMPLAARAIVFVVGGMRVAVVGIDSLGIEREDTDWIKSGIAGFHNGNVFLCASHSHAAPDLIGFWGWYFLTSGRDRDYLVRVRCGVAAAVAKALAGARPARLLRGEAMLPPAGLVKNSNRPGVFDRRVTVVQALDAASGAPLAALLHVGCHPEVLNRGNHLVSPDFVGELCARWKAAELGQPVFVNGELGAMVSPDVHDPTPHGVATMGQGIYELARHALEVARPVPVHDIEVRRADVYMNVESLALRIARLMIDIPRTLYRGCMRSTAGYLRIGDIEAACVPGEMEPGLAARVRSETHRPELLIFGLADDEVGYLMAERDARSRNYAYERIMSPAPNSGERVAHALGGRRLE